MRQAFYSDDQFTTEECDLCSPSLNGGEAKPNCFQCHGTGRVRVDLDGEVLAPWAAIIVDTEGGCSAFESVADYETWTRQR